MERNQLIRLGVFYDGNYFLHVSNYYNYFHQRRRRISISGLHNFIRYQVAYELDTDVRHCQIIDAHYFRGRMSAYDASQKSNQLYNDRLFDDVLMTENVITHYFPLRSKNGKKEEKNIDIWLALEAFESALFKKYDVLVLITSDGDFVPLVKKLHTIGTKVMLLSWEFEYQDDTDREIITKASTDLIEEVTYPVLMHNIIDMVENRNNTLINNLFVQQESTAKQFEEITSINGFKISRTLNMKDGYGFVAYPPNNLFFHQLDVIEGAFSDIQDGDQVMFTIELNEKGNEVAKNVKKVQGEFVNYAQ